MQIEQTQLVAEGNNALRDEYAVAMQSEQEAFAKSVEKLEKVVGGFGKHQDVGRTKEVAAEVKRLQEELRAAEEQRALFNKREAIFGQEQTDYSALAKVAKAFEPFATLASAE